MAVRLLNFVAIWCVILTLQFSSSTALISSPDLNPSSPKAFSVSIYLYNNPIFDCLGKYGIWMKWGGVAVGVEAVGVIRVGERPLLDLEERE